MSDKDESNTGSVGLVIGAVIVALFALCTLIGRCTKEDEIRTQCEDIHRFVAESSSGVSTAYQCERLGPQK
jgi:hypothetical protein